MIPGERSLRSPGPHVQKHTHTFNGVPNNKQQTNKQHKQTHTQTNRQHKRHTQTTQTTQNNTDNTNNTNDTATQQLQQPQQPTLPRRRRVLRRRGLMPVRPQDCQGRGVGARDELYGDDPGPPHPTAGALQPLRRRARRWAARVGHGPCAAGPG